MPATDAAPELERCRAAIAAAGEGPEEVIVVREPATGFPSVARNAGARHASGDVLVFVDADVAVRPDAFVRIRRAFAADPELTALFGAYDDAPAAPGVVPGFRYLLHHHIHREAAGPATTFWSGLGAVRRERFLDCGGFDEGRLWMEDVEFGLRLSATGGRILLDPEVQGTHLKSLTLRQMLVSDLRSRGVPWVILMLHRRERSTTLNLAWRHRAGAA
ncbi:MAG: glycosyltransferase family 2 protein, partial [Actinomycetota bacterium]|nr:glycosyltransferase family 2 protein [Actinomycetota bacterium]